MFFEAFSAFDNAILLFFHNLVTSTNGSLNGIVSLVSSFGEHGIGFIAVSLVLMLFKRTRRVGVTMLGAVAVGAIFTNLILKNAVMRTRPFETTNTYFEWWQAAGGTPETESSFPSGHTTAAFAFALALFLTAPKKWSWAGFVFAFIIAATRLYLCVHYPSDVLFGIIDGLAGAVIAYFIVKVAYGIMFRYADKKLIKFYFEFSVADFFRKKEKAENAETEKE